MSKNQKFIIKSLSQKYQVRENLFILWLYTPVLAIYMFQQVTFHAFALNIKNDKNIYKFYVISYTVRSFILLSQILVVIFAKKLHKKYKKMIRISNIIGIDNKTSDIQSISIKVSETYFTMLSNAWK
ncbi:7TM GPCR, serpentine receptor class e (Sre) family-containing protein [Strongyloides ratti]|uniref:7TM GPCR, serpentine receptor class e (Sre) family-containing protein n=1 Tax=Strongyloides ratti TaxID=34506 RepID=A0A090MZV8_STRRB|nr:7TM GPCR, serpentine receptor class e (Sre) family-containing protein [Strongyloides ratti]CEF69610.1 7TM GPCR, serpentine receptor class e (Sre) family-containing protein [Strongyloides ratti]